MTWARDLVALGRSTRIGRVSQRYIQRRGNRFAGAIAFYAFLSLFPFAALLGALIPLFLSGEAIAAAQDVLDDVFGGNAIDLQLLADNAASLGLTGAIGLLIPGTLAVDSVRGAVFAMWDVDKEPPRSVWTYVLDTVTLVGLIAALVVSVALTVLLTSVLSWLEELLGLTDRPGSVLAAQIVGLATALVIGGVLFYVLLGPLPRLTLPAIPALIASLLASAAFQLLNVAGGIYLASVAGRSYYLSFGLPISILIYLYVVSRILMVAAAWLAEGVTPMQRNDIAAGATANLTVTWPVR